MIKLLREIATDSFDIAKLSFKQYRMGGTSEAAVARRKRYEAEQMLAQAKQKAKEEEAVLLEVREKALSDLAELQGKALQAGVGNPLDSNFGKVNEK
jgi:hypothetical protein